MKRVCECCGSTELVGLVEVEAELLPASRVWFRWRLCWWCRKNVPGLVPQVVEELKAGLGSVTLGSA